MFDQKLLSPFHATPRGFQKAQVGPFFTKLYHFNKKIGLSETGYTYQENCSEIPHQTWMTRSASCPHMFPWLSRCHLPWCNRCGTSSFPLQHSLAFPGLCGSCPCSQSICTCTSLKKKNVPLLSLFVWLIDPVYLLGLCERCLHTPVSYTHLTLPTIYSV